MTAEQTRTRPASHRTPAAHGGAIATAPWRRAPLLLLRQPVVFLAIVGAAAILAVAAASGPLFLSTIGTASFAAQADQRCPEDGQPTVRAMAGGTSAAPIEQAGLRQYTAHGYPNAPTSESPAWSKQLASHSVSICARTAGSEAPGSPVQMIRVTDERASFSSF